MKVSIARATHATPYRHLVQDAPSHRTWCGRSVENVMEVDENVAEYIVDCLTCLRIKRSSR